MRISDWSSDVCSSDLLEVSAIRLRQEIRDWPLYYAVAVIGQLHVGDDLGLEQADGVARHRIAKARVKLFGHSRAAHHIAAFENADLETSARQIEGADEPVVAAADDYCVIMQIGRAHV